MATGKMMAAESAVAVVTQLSIAIYTKTTAAEAAVVEIISPSAPFS